MREVGKLGFALFVTQTVANALLATLLLGLHRTYRRAFLAHWGLAWLALALSFAADSLSMSLPARGDADPLHRLVLSLALVCGYGYVTGVLSGTWLLVTGRSSRRGIVPVLLALPLALGTALALGTGGLEPGPRALVRVGLVHFAEGAAFLGAAFALARVARRERLLSRWVMVVLFVFAGAVKLQQFAMQAVYIDGVPVDSLVGLVGPPALELFVSFLFLPGLAAWFLEDERRDLARATLALAESEEQRRRSERMDAVGRLAGGVAHDFNNLLTAIIGHAELLLLRAGVGHPDREDLVPIARAAARAADLVRELLTFSRRQPLHPRHFVLDELLGRIKKTIESLLGENARLELALHAPGAVLHADPTQLELAVFNLVSNAREAIHGSGRLRLATAETRIEAGDASGLAPGRYLLLEVADDGCGIPPAARDKVFEPFFTTKQGRNTGLGLSSVYGIVKTSGGEIRVESELERGTTFRIWLPLVEAAPESCVELVPATFGRGGDECILLVEDEAQVRLLAQRLLARAGYRVVVVESGDEACARLRASPNEFQLLLSDVVMPGMPLEQLLATVRREHPGLRVVLMSGYSEASIGKHGVELAREHFVQKPFSARELLDAVRTALDGPPRTPRARSDEPRQPKHGEQPA